MQILLSNSQAGPGRTVKQEQEDISRNHVQTFISPSVQTNLQNLKVVDSYLTFLINPFFAPQRNLPAVFIDTFYDKGSRTERERFDENTDKLWKFAKSRNPFECKDIKIALTEIRELQVGNKRA